MSRIHRVSLPDAAHLLAVNFQARIKRRGKQAKGTQRLMEIAN